MESREFFFFSKRYNNNLYSSQLDNFIFISVVNQSREGRRNFIEQVRSPIIINTAPVRARFRILTTNNAFSRSEEEWFYSTVFGETPNQTASRDIWTAARALVSKMPRLININKLRSERRGDATPCLVGCVMFETTAFSPTIYSRSNYRLR